MMMNNGMILWLLIMVLALALILPAMLVLLRRGRDTTGREGYAKRKHQVDDAPNDEALARLEQEGIVWLEDDGELPVELQDWLSDDDKPKRHEDG